MIFLVFDDDARPAIQLTHPEIADNYEARGVTGHVIQATAAGAGGFTLQHKRIVGASYVTREAALARLDSTLRHRITSAKARKEINRRRKERDAREAPDAPVSSYEWRPGGHWRDEWQGQRDR